MCDTIVALPEVTKDGRMIFAKNSDRSPNEPLLTVYFPERKNPGGSEVRLTYIKIPEAPKVNAVTLVKPSWLWGAEMGFNEYGLNIGNEAVFTKLKRDGPEALTGMDVVRLALERCDSAANALDLMINLLQEYGQGGNSGYDHKFYYHNSFLIADKKEAYALETAGEHFAVKKIKGFYTISNCLTIEGDYDRIDEDAVVFADRKGYIGKGRRFGFNSAFSDKLYTKFSKSRERRAFTMSGLEKDAGNITVESVIKILRGHSPDKREDSASVGSVCMHAGGIVGDHTAGSYVASLKKDENYYITGSSMPCLSFFKPYVFGSPVVPSDESEARRVWANEERLKRYFISGQADRENYIKERDALEERYLTLFEYATKDMKAGVVKNAWGDGANLVNKYLDKVGGAEYKFTKGSAYYKRYWTKKTKVFLEENE
jgi:Dipeptidase